MLGETDAVRLLLIDDAEMARDVLAVMLAEVGSDCELSWREDYDSGLAAVLEGTFDVCLLDYRLGERSGLDLLREARALGSRTPVIMLTGHGSAELDREAMHAGAGDYLIKGDFTAESLDRSIRYLRERARAEEALRDSEERYALAMEGSNDGLWDWRVGAEEAHLSPRWMRILGFEPNELPGFIDSWWARMHEDDRPRVRREFEAHLADGTTPHFENEHRLLHKDGTWRHVLVRGKAVRDSRGRALRIAGSLTDVTLAKSRDPLTGLPNRVLYLNRVEHAFKRMARDTAYHFALLFIDLDRFKNVNDSLGHDAGDELLVAIARRLENCVRAVDTVARLGGDEFVVLLDDSREPDGAIRAAERIIFEFGLPFRIAGREVFSGASIGIALSSPHYNSPGELLRDADTAMYRAKAQGRARFVIFDAEMHARALQVLSVESGLRRALTANELEVFYQPVVDLPSGKPQGFEALVRWRHPERGLISPADFIPVAEDSNLIVMLDLYVLRNALLQLREWRARFGNDLTMSINTSRRHFAANTYAGQLQQAIEEVGVPANALRIEVTESMTMELSQDARAQLHAIHALGVQIYIDDFGIGYSSLSMLHTYPFSGLKLDRSFVSSLEDTSKSAEVVKAVIAMAQALALDVVAEGVETQAQATRLHQLGCPGAQGYHFGRPMPAASIPDWLKDRP